VLPQTPSWILGAYFEGEGRDERGREGRAGRGKEEGDRVGGRRGEGAGSTPRLKLGPPELFLLAPALWKANIGLSVSVN